ncbi:hypothetical protein [Actinomadura parmotrematis]|uniref:Guanylate cyclase domain-containing protein n=1 Tax=Actinomadura parmotrematis TaxID=2864039 RepID=A0ABS7FZQ0_9ACTN|nr:hypothetical protein [Actinomadura parmotrematis]MBW8485931.1 hypothetical protein [Actinomadura parmotrematis]
MIFVADIMEFSRRDDQAQLALRRVLFPLVAHAFDGAGLPWRLRLHEDRGDGVLVVVPVPVSIEPVVRGLVRRLVRGLAEHNRSADPPDRMRLRAALHTGIVHRDRYGVAGTPVNHTFRLVDAPSIRDALTASAADLAFALSETAYGDLTVPSLPGFRAALAEVKRTSAPIWIWTGRPVDALL